MLMAPKWFTRTMYCLYKYKLVTKQRPTEQWARAKRSKRSKVDLPRNKKSKKLPLTWSRCKICLLYVGILCCTEM